MNDWSKVVCFITICALVLLFVGTACYFDYWNDETEWRLKKIANHVLATKGEIETQKDCWGTEIRWDFQPGETVNYATAISASWDKIFGTHDDIKVVEADYNVTGILSRWAGSKAGEAATLEELMEKISAIYGRY